MTFPQGEPEFANTAPADDSPELLTANVTVVSLYEPDERVEDRRTALRGLVPGAAAVIVGGVTLLLTTQVQTVKNTPLGPPFWPGMVGWAMLVLGLVLLAVFFTRGLRWGDVPDPPTAWGVTRLAGTVVLLVGYLLLWDVLQFWVSTLIVVFLLVVLYGARGWKPLTIFPVAITALLHFLFVVALKVPL